MIGLGRLRSDIDRGASEKGSLWLIRTRIQNRACEDGWDGRLLSHPIPREPGATVMTVGDKVDGVLVGMEGRYSSMAAGFR